MIVQFNFPTTIRFGEDAAVEIPDIISRHCQRPLVITDRNIVGLSFIKRILSYLEDRGLDFRVYSEIGGNPVESQVVGGVEAYHQHKSDGIIMIGGGATIDVGKAVALMVNHPGKLFDYEDGRADARPSNQSFPYMIAVPTTAGTGSEVGRSSVISDNDTKEKKIIFAPQMLPNIVIADPKLTVDLPIQISAYTGLDALTHLIEAYLAKGFHPMCDGIALEGISLVAQNLTKVIQCPENIAARGAMLMASMMGAVAFQKGLGVTHSCAHAMSTVFDTHHGLANAIMLVPAMKFNIEAVPERFEKMSLAAGLSSKSDFIPWLENLRRECHIPAKLSEIGVYPNERLIDVAQNDICHPSNPRPVGREDFIRLFSQVET